MRIVVVPLVLCMLCIAAGAFAENYVTIETKSVALGGSNITVGITIANDDPLAGLNIPCIVREIDPGSFWREPLPVYKVGTIDQGVEFFWDPPTFPVLLGPVEPCEGCNHPYLSAYPDIADYNAVSADAFLIYAASIPPSLLNPTPEGALRIQLTFNVNEVAGRFELDTALWMDGTGLLFTDGEYPPNSFIPSFTKGIITILPSHCPTDPGGYTLALVEGIAGESLSNTIGIPAFDPEGDPIDYHLVSGPGGVDPSTGAWNWTPGAEDAGDYTVLIEVSDNVLDIGTCLQNRISFDVSVGLSECPDDPGAYAESIIEGLEGDLLSNQIAFPAHDPNGDAIRYYLVSGPGAVDLNTGEWTWDPGCGVTGDYTVNVEVTDDMLGEGMCGGNLLSFDVSMAGIPRGDWDCDGKMTPLDVVWMVNYIYRLQGDGPCDPCAK